jgi:hypothetical protein
MNPVLRRAALMLLCSALAACAGEDGAGGGPGRLGDGGSPGRDGARPRRPLPNIFISPAGEPFRAGPGAPYPVTEWFARADSDHDGRLTRAEMRADALHFFDRLDENHDGVIDGLELQDYEQKVAPEILPQIVDLRAGEGMDQSLTFGDPRNADNRSERRGSGLANRQPAPAQGVGVQGAAVYSLENTPEPVAAADAQLDGRITRAEFARAVDSRFDLLDKSHSGYLTLAILPKTPLQAEMAKRRQASRRKGQSTRQGAPPPPPEAP